MTVTPVHTLATLEDVDRTVMSLQADVCATLGPAVAARFEICMSEALTNIVKHGQTAAPDAQIEMVLAWAGDAVTVEILDLPGAAPFDLRTHAPRLDEIDPLAEGGRGLALIMHCATAVDYVTSGPRNRLVLTFQKTPE